MEGLKMKKAETKDRIKEAMEIREIKQSELVEKTGIDKGQMSSYLSGKYKPKQRNINLIAQALSVDEAWLMGYDVPMDGCIHGSSETVSPKIMQYYDLLNDIGKHEATKRVMELTEVPRYLKEDAKYSAEPAPYKDYLLPNAAHADEDIEEITEDMKRAEDDIMDNL